MEQLTKRAYGKINLALDVLQKRPDGYHELRTVMQTVGIYDELTFVKRADREIHITLAKNGAADTNDAEKTDCAAAGSSAAAQAAGQELPCDERNLIYRAAKAVMAHDGRCGGIDVLLIKRIPLAAGMAGGSADAAAAVLALNELYGLGMDRETMNGIAAGIGADVPYCLTGGTVLCEGIGEVLTPLTPASGSRLILVKPDIGVATAEVYAKLDQAERLRHPDVDGMVRAIARRDARAVAQRLGNVLEAVTVPEHPVIGRIKQILAECGAEGVLMTGSGPTVFAMFESEESRQRAYGRLRGMNEGWQIFLTEFVPDIRG